VDRFSLSLCPVSCPVLAAGNGDATGGVCEIHLNPNGFFGPGSGVGYAGKGPPKGRADHLTFWGGFSEHGIILYYYRVEDGRTDGRTGGRHGGTALFSHITYNIYIFQKKI